MIASGANVKTVQSQLGHKTATMTLDQYGHLFPDDLDDMTPMDGPSGVTRRNVPKMCPQRKQARANNCPDQLLLLWSCRESNPAQKSR